MLTTVQTYVNELTSYQVPAEQRARLGGKGPAMKALAAKIKELWPSLNQDDKALFVAAISRGRFAITPDIWNLFLDAVGSSAPAPAPAPAPAAPAATNKVAGEILETCKATQVTVNKQADSIAALVLLVEELAERQASFTVDMAKTLQAIDLLQQHVKELKKPAPRRGAKANVEMIDMPV